MSEPTELITNVLTQVQKKFANNITLSNILEIIALTMMSAEKWHHGYLSGKEKKQLVMDSVHAIVVKYAKHDERDAILEYVDTFGGMGIELVIWLSQNHEVLKTINSVTCGGIFACCKK